MHLEILSYSSKEGWAPQAFPELDSDSTLVIVFGASSFFDTSAPFEALGKAYPNSKIIGCSTSGEIRESNISDETLVVTIAKFEKSTIRTFNTSVASSEESFPAGCAIANALLHPDLRGVFVLSDGLCVNGSELIRGLNANLPESVVVTGGLAGDGARFQRTWVIQNGIPAAQRVSAVGFYGKNVHIGHGSKGGWDNFGPERIVTKSKDNILYELDGKPALALYKEYLGDRAAGLPATALLFPLALRRGQEGCETVVRTILSVDEATQSMTFAGDVPEGSCAQLMRANFDRLINGASLAAENTNVTLEEFGPETLAIAISCVGRRLILGERTEEEIEATLDVLPIGTKQVGFYSYGEISPYATGHCDLHNQTMTLTTITES